MSSEWQHFKVADLQARGWLLVEDGNHGEYRPRPDEFTQDGVSFIRAADMANGEVLFGSAQRINSIAKARIRKGIGQPGDILLSHKGTVGKLALVPEKCPDYVCSPQTTFWRVLDESVLDRHFLYAYMRSRVFTLQLASRKGETDMADYVSLTAQRQLMLPVPPMNVQRMIGQVTHVIDSRIRLLHKTNATLESIAQALFKSWFVDFDPVRAKQEGRAPEGMDEATAALFPDGFEESELGMVPKGWRITTLEELCSVITNGGTPSRSKAEFWQEGSIPWFKTGEFADGFLLSPSERITPSALESSSVKLLPKDAILMAIYAAPTVGRLGILTEPAAFNQACTGMVAKPEIGPWFLFLVLYFGRDWFNSRANGAAQQNISKAIVTTYKLVRPSDAVLLRLNDIIGSIFESIRANSSKAQTLTELRDRLLPRLISGQLRLPDAEALIEEAA